MQYEEGGNQLRIARLRDRGVDVWGAEHVYVGEEVPLHNIEKGAAIYAGILTGPKLWIGRGAKIGVSGPARISNCQIGRDCEIGAGTFDEATFLDGAKVRGFAEVRSGTLLEEGCDAAHSVAFKNTILTANCVVGSLINYCDIFMSGGPSREDHSEVGSGAIHFNFDPRGDKWGSLVGDARAVLLRSAPVFVGGQVGLVGPLTVGFGAVVAAGSVVRGEVEENCISFSPAAAEARTLKGFDREIYGSVTSKLRATAKLAGTLDAMDAWYEYVRAPFADEHQKILYEAARGQIRRNIEERAKRIGKLIDKLEKSVAKTRGSAERGRLTEEHEKVIGLRAEIGETLTQGVDQGGPSDRALEAYETARATESHLDAVRALGTSEVVELWGWLEARMAEPVRRLSGLID